MKKLFKIVFLAFFVPIVSLAQSEYISASENAEKTEDVNLGGKTSFVFESKIKDLVITSSINSDEQKPQAKSVGDGYQYELTVTADRKRTFTVTKMGTAYSTTVTKLPSKDRRFYFTVNEIANPIMLENQSGRSDLYPVERKACIQITSPINDLLVKYSKKLGAKIKRETAPSGALLIKLEVDMDSLNKYRGNVNNVQSRYDEITKIIRTKESQDRKSITDEEWDLQESLQKKLVAAQSDWIEVSNIQLSGKETNIIHLPVEDIMAIQSKSLTPYGILLLKEKVFASKFEELKNQAENYTKAREYGLAAAYYTSAAEVDAISAADKALATDCANRMSKLNQYKDYLDIKADELYLTIKSGGMINKKKLFGMMDDVIALNKSMYKETNDTYYLEEANRLSGEKQKVGLVIKGRFVMSEYKGGIVNETPITNVRIYGSQAFNCDDMDKTSYPNKGELITTVTDPEGKYSFNFPQGKYRTIIFEAVNNSQIKVNKHISVVGRNEDRNIKIRFPKK